ncbi:MAG: hypothetical protein LUF85_17765 [Bacteroides sp.]|nr:hypothetical protein [Bacteroides sp.]
MAETFAIGRRYLYGFPRIREIEREKVRTFVGADLSFYPATPLGDNVTGIAENKPIE